MVIEDKERKGNLPYAIRTVVTWRMEMYLMNLLDLIKEILRQKDTNTKWCL